MDEAFLRRARLYNLLMYCERRHDIKCTLFANCKKTTMRKRIWQVLFTCCIIPSLLPAQVTTSTISGIVRTSTEPLAGASITATHLPSGTVYRTASMTRGVFNI